MTEIWAGGKEAAMERAQDLIIAMLDDKDAREQYRTADVTDIEWIEMMKVKVHFSNNLESKLIWGASAFYVRYGTVVEK